MSPIPPKLNPLGEDRPGKRGADLQTDRRDHRKQGVAHDVPTADGPVGQAFGLGGADVVLVEDVQDLAQVIRKITAKGIEARATAGGSGV